MFILALSMVAPAVVAEDLVVIVNPKSGVSQLTREEVVDVFMGRNRQLPSRLTALPLDLPSSTAEREQFYRQLTGRSLAEINAYWARLMFTGRATPPILVSGQDESLLMVMDNRSAVAYVSRSRVNAQVKVVYEVGGK